MRLPKRAMNALFSALLERVAFARDPDFIIGGAERPYLLRWWVIPRNRFFNVYLHLFCRSDDDRALHDHPWLFNCSVLLDGEYVEHTSSGVHYRETGAVKFRWGGAPHRIQLLPRLYGRRDEFPVWTLFITGPKVREWGFYCTRGWRHWREFTSPHDGGQVGRGCD